MKTTKKERKIVKELIKKLKKLNNDGIIKVLETDSRAEIEEIENNGKLVISHSSGTFVDVMLYVYTR